MYVKVSGKIDSGGVSSSCEGYKEHVGFLTGTPRKSVPKA